MEDIGIDRVYEILSDLKVPWRWIWPWGWLLNAGSRFIWGYEKLAGYCWVWNLEGIGWLAVKSLGER